MNVTYHSFLPHLGYGIAAKGYVELMRQTGSTKVNQKAYDFNSGIEQTGPPDFEGEADVNFIHLTPNYTQKVYAPKQINLLNTVFESTEFPAEWRQEVEKVDRIAVPCTWNQRVFEEVLQRDIYLLPHTSQFEGRIPSPSSILSTVPADTFVFLTVATWELRKNIEGLLDAFCSAFSAKDNVLLVLKTSQNNLTAQHKHWWGRRYLETTTNSLAKILRKKKNPPRIQLISSVLNDHDMQNLYNRCNAYVTLTHGEGWGLGCYEAAWFGKPVIATGFGGYLDFLTPDTAYLLPYTLIPYKRNFWDADDRVNHQYAQPDRDTAIECMRLVYGDLSTANERGRQLKSFVEKKFSKMVISHRLRMFLHS